MALILTLEDLNQEQSIKQLETNKVSITTFNTTVNQIESEISELNKKCDDNLVTAKSYADELVKSLKENEIAALQSAIDVLNGDVNTEGSVDFKISQAISKLVDGAPEALDTLKEIVDFIKNTEVDVENLIDAVNARVDKLVDGASADYNTLGKIEQRIKELAAKEAEDINKLEEKIETVGSSLPVYKYDAGLPLNKEDDVYTFETTYIPNGDILENRAMIYFTDDIGNIIKVADATVSKVDGNPKKYKVELPNDFITRFATELGQSKVSVSYFWRNIDNQ